jgi:beta-mannanase
MKATSFRMSLLVIALLLSVLLVVAFSFLGDKTKGPISDLFAASSDFIKKTENDLIIQTRENKRADKLKWLTKYTTASLKNPAEILFGAFDNQAVESFESIINLEDSLKNTFPLIQIYTAWGSKPEEKFPQTQVESIRALGSIPVITWEPWLTDFNAEDYPRLRAIKERDKGGLKDITKGLYDNYIIEWALEAAKIKSPLFLRVGHEMNDPYRYPWGPQNNSANDFIAAHRHIHKLFSKVGATNVIWIWSPHPAYGFFNEFYPGDTYVDYVGVSALNYGTVASWSKWWSFKEIFGNYYKTLSRFKKPIMITEFGSLEVGGKRSVWFKEALDSLPVKYPYVRSVLFFHYSDDKTTTQQTINWYIVKDVETISTIKDVIKTWPKQNTPHS